MINKIGRDKWKHFFVGIAMGVSLLLIGHWLLPGRPWTSVILVLVIIVTICYGFELFSKFTGLGYYEVMDAVAGIAGGVLGMGLACCIIYFLR